MNHNIGAVALAIVLLPGFAACSQSPSRSQADAMPTIATSTKSDQPKATIIKSEHAIPQIDQADILGAQKALISLGYNVGNADGILGPSTRAAVMAFQKAHNLASDGRITLTLLRLLNQQVAELPKSTTISVRAGDAIVYADGKVDSSNTDRAVEWGEASGRSVVAVRPSTRVWPSAARAGLDWAIAHALDGNEANSVQWSSTGVNQKFDIQVLPSLSIYEEKVAGAAVCRHFELRDTLTSLRYPAIACKDSKDVWYIAHSKIRIARPANALNTSAESGGAAQ